MDFKNLEDIYKYLKPSDLQGSFQESTTKKESIVDILSKMILAPRGELYSSEKIFNDVETHFKGGLTGADEVSKAKTGTQFHAIANTKRLDLGDADYWGQGVENLSGIIGAIKEKNFVASVFVSRSPYITPAARGTDNVDFFLNYTPPVVASSMVPYLDVEFQMQGASLDSLNTPSSLRFLIGTKADSELSPQDKVIRDADLFKSQKSEENFGLSGMEMFLMPQTLTNMDDLLPHKGRLVRAKPFLPFASLQGFDVTIVNAGAGAFAHKKGTLKFVIHDKARISEIAEFIKGSSGFNKAIIWTTYGWIAPMNRMQEDDYAKFINESMLIRECWSVVNSQFSFDGSGQVSMNLELVSRAAKALESLTVDEVSDEIKDFHEVIKSIAEIKTKLVGENKFAISVAADQLLNAASTSGFLNELKDVKKTIASLKENLKYSNLPSAQIKELDDKLGTLNEGKYSYEKIKKSIGTSVAKKFIDLSKNKDPFLAAKDKKPDYFSDPLLAKSISEFKDKHEKRMEAIKASSANNPDLNAGIEVVSFGKLFTSFVAPRVASSMSCDELQIFFYGLNDQCGPLSNQSIAEFPVNLTALKYAYNNAIKTTGLESLTIQTFLRLIIETQFSDQRAIGYGMNSYFDQIDPAKPSEMHRIENSKDVEAGMSKWISRYGSLTIPVIEMFVENGEESDKIKYTVEQLKRSATRLNYEENNAVPASRGGSKKIIKRIHIYDRANNPYRLAQQIINAGSSFEVAEILTGPADAKLKEVIKGIDSAKLKKLQEDLNGGVDYKTALLKAGVGQSTVDDLVTIRRPGADKVVIPKDRKKLKDYLMSQVPCIFVGTNGTMVLSSNAASATSGLQGALNIMNASKSAAKGQATVSSNPLEEVGGLPLRTVPIQLTMTTMGVPIAQLYQTYFVDFETGTSLDNIYNCTQLQHSITPGKFTTNWTFMYASGYGKFTAPPSVTGFMDQRARTVINEAVAALKPSKK